MCLNLQAEVSLLRSTNAPALGSNSQPQNVFFLAHVPFSSQHCSDRVTALMKMYTDGKHDNLFKHGTMEENSRKETIFCEINDTLIRKNRKMDGWTMVDGNGKKSVIMSITEASSLSMSDYFIPPQKRRKVDASVGVKTAAESDI
ncbi:hypothetical protein PsorP6_012975 [Peronosclerospora sorghi]|uniref:Uncharacterized protein n=1 Tax=Peronosclerospora sorghi TaxID=230839 RepID=A0ACC0WIA2_9STRA|nr:hypothetical protein PsorP6_012975 [Peronosclerospora sorghi]